MTRSQVFAQLLVQDIDLDQMFVVGTNIDGFESFYEDAVTTFVKELDLSTAAAAQSTLVEYGRRLRIPETQSALDRRVAGLPATHEISQNFLAFQTLREELIRGPYKPGLAEKIRSFLGQCLRKKLVTIPPDTDAATLLQIILAATPPGFDNTMHGMQNIKGPGLLWLELWEQLALLEKQQRISAASETELRAFAAERKILENPLCAAFLRRGADEGRAAAPIDDESATDHGPGQARPRLASTAKQKIRSFARPNHEVVRTRRIKAVYRNLASGRCSAAEATAAIRKAQGH